MRKNRLLTLLAAILLLATVFTGCATARTLDRVEDELENRLDAAEDAVENMIEDSVQTAAPPANTQPSATKGKLTKEEAEAIALKDAGLTQAEVTGLRSEYEVDDGVPEWEVDFRSGGWEYDYTIHAETGAILHSDKDRD